MSFEEVWPEMKPVVHKMLKQEPVTKDQWQDLFYAVHLVCLWDDQGPYKIRQLLQSDITQYLNQIQQVSFFL